MSVRENRSSMHGLFCRKKIKKLASLLPSVSFGNLGLSDSGCSLASSDMILAINYIASKFMITTIFSSILVVVLVRTAIKFPTKFNAKAGH